MNNKSIVISLVGLVVVVTGCRTVGQTSSSTTSFEEWVPVRQESCQKATERFLGTFGFSKVKVIVESPTSCFFLLDDIPSDRRDGLVGQMKMKVGTEFVSVHRPFGLKGEFNKVEVTIRQ